MPTAPDARRRLLHTSLARMPASLFQFDPRMAEGWLADRYFVRTAGTLAEDGRDPVVRMQLFAKQRGILAGVPEVIRMLETQLAPIPAVNGRPATLHDFTIDTLLDGDEIDPAEPVMHITGPYLAFAHLETAYLGVLARRTLVASNVRRAISAAAGKPVIFMAARHDDWRVQVPDGYAAMVGGAELVSSDANTAWWGNSGGSGTMPHSMIAAYGGDTVAATLAFTRYVRAHEPEVGVVSLVDYQNDVIGTSLAVARAMRAEYGPGALQAVRVDTSESLVDASLAGYAATHPREPSGGVNARLVRTLRDALDAADFPEVGIIVSGGFTPARIGAFERLRVPVIAYGVGSSLLGHNAGEPAGLLTSFDFTADVVRVDGRRESKVGREERGNDRFVRLDPDEV
ncbi:MAG: quinolinate phosphoribosyl transferase [Gemmatimonadales bacterium]